MILRGNSLSSQESTEQMFFFDRNYCLFFIFYILPQWEVLHGSSPVFPNMPVTSAIRNKKAGHIVIFCQ